MQNQSVHNQEYIFNYYRYAIDNFEKFTSNFLTPNSNNNFSSYGYLINLKDYEEYKIIIGYHNNMNFQNNYINNYEDIIPLKQIKFRTSDYLANMLLNGNEYIIITPELWKVVCNKEKQNENPFIYEIRNRQIIFTLDGKMTFIFNFNDSKKFIIEKSTFAKIINFDSCYDIIIKIYNAIINYYKFEKDFSNKLNQDENYIEKEKYYLISKNWLDKWKYNFNYEIIKDIIDRKKIDEHNIKNLIIYFQKCYYNNYKFDEIKIVDFKNKEEMENHLQNDSFAIVSKEFCSLFNLINPNCFLGYKIHNYIISLNFGNDIISFKSNDNIISKSKKDNSLSFNIHDFKHLNQLLKIYFFQKELKEKINIPHNSSKNNEENNIYLIDKKEINKYKEYFQYNEIFKLLENNNKIKNLNYQNYESNLEVIMSVIKEDYINYYKSLQINTNFQKDSNNLGLTLEQYPFKNNLNYIIDFEFINKDIASFFIENNVFQKKQFIEGKYIGEDQKIIIFFEFNKYKYYELGSFDSNRNLHIEYIMDEIRNDYKNIIIDCFKSHSIGSIYKNILQNENYVLNFKNKNIGIFYKIEENKKIQKSINNENVQNNQNNNFVSKILSTLISLYFCENYLIKEVKESSKNTISNNTCYLVNKNFILKLKQLFSLKEIEKIINIYKLSSNSTADENILNKIDKKYLNFILNKQKDFEQIISNNQSLQIEKLTYNNNSQIIYPNNFYIVSKDFYHNLLKICNIEENKIHNEPYFFGFNYGKIVLSSLNKNNKSINTNEEIFVYVVSLKKEDNENINYIQEMLLLLFGNSQDKINNFKNIITGCDIIKSYTFNSDSFDKNYNCKGYIINQDITNKIKKKEDNLKKYLNYISNLYNEFSTLNKKINEQNSSNMVNEEDDYYLIKRNYIHDIESLLCFKDISLIIKNIQTLNSSCNGINLQEAIRKQLGLEIYNSLSELNDETIKNKLKDRNLYSLSYLCDKNNELYYYNNFQIVSKKIKDLIEVIDPNNHNNNINNNNKHVIFRLVKCILDKGKIILFLNKNIISLGKLNEKNEFYIDYIIKLNKNSFDFHFNNIKKNRYNYLEQYFINVNKKFMKDINLDKNVAKLIEEYNISEKLQALILIVVQQQNLIKNDILKENNKYQKVFLINKKCLLNYQYEKLFSIIQQDEKIKELTGYNNSKVSIDWNALNYNISTSSLESLKEIDNDIKDISSSFNEPEEESININRKQISIPKEFIIVNEEIYKLLKKTYNIKLSNTCDYFKKNDNIILKINSKNIILLLIVTNNTNYYNIKYIFEYNNHIEYEFNEIFSKGIEEYMKEKTIFNENIRNDCISPIFSGNNIIGNCYKYIGDYANCINYSDLLSNDIFKKALKLYFFYNKLFEKINKKSNPEENYYLVNKDFMNQIKKDYNYNEIKNLLKDSRINEENKDKTILKIIKNQQDNFIKNLFEKDNLKNKYHEDLTEPEILPINFKINDQKTQIMIFQSIEIVPKDIIELFVEKIRENRDNYLKCTLQENKIIICYPKILGNQLFVSILGNLNKENTFINEYILIYKESSSQSKHKKKIVNDVINFINQIQTNMFNNSTPIVDESCKEVGIIIKYENNIRESMFNWTIEKNENYVNANSEQEIVKNKEPNNNLLVKIDKDSLKKHFDFPPLIGLQNIGATCYMNATLQCFCHIEKFVYNFKYNQNIIDIANKDSKTLTYSFKSLIEKLWPNNYNDPYFNEKIFAPKEFKEKISTLNPLFEGIAANDAKDLVNFIIMTLHIELNKKPNNSNINNMILDQTNQQLMLKSFMEEFTSNNKSIISDLFYAVNCNKTQCTNCSIIIYNYQAYFFLVFPLEEVRKFKYNNYQYNFNNNINVVDILDCFEYDRKINLMSGENSMYCNNCKRNSNCCMRTNLITCPEILIILLNRGHGIEFNIKINFPENLNLFNYIELNNTGYNYQLIGVITHIGESSMSGHFIAYCKDPISNLWHKYNDAIVNEVSDFQNEVINFAMPYLLFYQKV